MLLNILKFTQQLARAKHILAQKGNNEKPNLSPKEMEISKASIFPLESVDPSIYVFSPILMLSPLVKIHQPGALSFPVEQNHPLENLAA